MAANVEETKRFSAADARALPAFEEDLAELVQAVLPSFNWTAPDPRVRSLSDLQALARWGRIGLRQRKRLADLAFLFSTSATQLLSERFEDRARDGRAGLARDQRQRGRPVDARAPRTSSSTTTRASEAEGGVRQWGFVRGGMGRVTEAMADAAREAGCEIRCDAEVERIVSRGRRGGGRAARGRRGDRAAGGCSRTPIRSGPSCSCAIPTTCPQDFLAKIEAYRCIGTSIKINLAVRELPYVKGLPEGGVQPYHTGIMELNPFIPDMDAQQAQAVQGIPADPSHIELCFPTVHDPSLAPEGRHIVTIDVNSQPYRLREGSWDEIKEARADRVVAAIAEHFPTLPDLIEHRQVVTPLDMERLMGLTGGHALHGEMAPDQLLFLRPARGWADYRTPIRGLYLCGAGTHPGGGVTGANGRNAASEVIRDAKRSGRNAVDEDG